MTFSEDTVKPPQLVASSLQPQPLPEMPPRKWQRRTEKEIKATVAQYLAMLKSDKYSTQVDFLKEYRRASGHHITPSTFSLQVNNPKYNPALLGGKLTAKEALRAEKSGKEEPEQPMVLATACGATSEQEGNKSNTVSCGSLRHHLSTCKACQQYTLKSSNKKARNASCQAPEQNETQQSPPVQSVNDRGDSDSNSVPQRPDAIIKSPNKKARKASYQSPEQNEIQQSLSVNDRGDSDSNSGASNNTNGSGEEGEVRPNATPSAGPNQTEQEMQNQLAPASSTEEMEESDYATATEEMEEPDYATATEETPPEDTKPCAPTPTTMSNLPPQRPDAIVSTSAPPAVPPPTEKQLRIEQMVDYISQDVFGNNFNPATMAKYAIKLYDLGFESVQVMQAYLKPPHLESFEWMPCLHKEIFLETLETMATVS